MFHVLAVAFQQRIIRFKITHQIRQPVAMQGLYRDITLGAQRELLQRRQSSRLAEHLLRFLQLPLQVEQASQSKNGDIGSDMGAADAHVLAEGLLRFLQLPLQVEQRGVLELRRAVEVPLALGRLRLDLHTLYLLAQPVHAVEERLLLLPAMRQLLVGRP